MNDQSIRTQVPLSTLVVALLCVTYVFLLRPLRGWVADDVATPVLLHLEAKSASAAQVVASPPARTVQVRVPPENGEAGPRVQHIGFGMPGGITFLLPALVLAAWSPRRPYWLYFLGVHVAVAVVAFLAIAAGLAYGRWGFVAFHFIDGYILDALSLAAAVAPFILAQRNRLTRET